MKNCTVLSTVRGSTKIALLALVFCLSLLPLGVPAAPSVFATGLNGPVKIDVSPGGAFVVSERGSGLNDGGLSLVDWHGNVRPLLSGLPSGIEVTGVPSEPTAVVLHGCCIVDLAIGEGDTLDFDLSGAPGSQVPNPTAANSPLFSSVLRVFFSRSVDDLTGGFELSRDDHETLADGFTVRLTNDAGIALGCGSSPTSKIFDRIR